MQTVFFDPSRRAATGRPLAAEPPAGLIDGQLISPFVLRARQFNAAAIDAQPPPITATLIGRDCPIAAPVLDRDADRYDPQPRPQSTRCVGPHVERIHPFPLAGAPIEISAKPSVVLLSFGRGSASDTDQLVFRSRSDYRGRARSVAIVFAYQSAVLGNDPGRKRDRRKLSMVSRRREPRSAHERRSFPGHRRASSRGSVSVKSAWERRAGPILTGHRAASCITSRVRVPLHSCSAGK